MERGVAALHGERVLLGVSGGIAAYKSAELVRRLREAALAAPSCFPDAREVITLDGVRVEFARGFGLARPSNTTPVVVLRFEADDADALAAIQQAFRRAVDGVWPGLALPF